MTATKPDSYYSNPRTDMVTSLPDPLGRVLDVGCGSGSTGVLLRARGPESMIGVEIVPEAAALARSAYDQVLVGSVEQVLSQVEGPIDTVLCYDVLEHLVDPWEVLRQLRELAAPGARLHVSVPNARHLSLAYDVYLRGSFAYSAHGHRDNTHLRWFTPRDIETAIANAGFDVVYSASAPLPVWRAALGRLTHGLSSQFLSMQWQVLAVRRG
jgi:2-polyprenyl-3-methyl-5-hydroxy-6-metoxy-1,4-benzoquinol methylase